MECSRYGYDGKESLWIGDYLSSGATRLADAADGLSSAILETGEDGFAVTADGERLSAPKPTDEAKVEAGRFVDLRLTPTRNINGVLKISDSRTIAVGDDGGLLVGELHAGEALAFTRRESHTLADLRSVYFQDGRIGWASSGWDEDSDERSDQTGFARPVILQTLDGGENWKGFPTGLFHRLGPFSAHYLLLLFSLYGSFAAWRAIPEEPIEAITGAARPDKPIGWNDHDVLGIKPLANAIQRFLRNSGTSPPLTISIEGKWGTGKSSLMNLVRERLCEHGDRPVWFNAWHHQSDEQLFAALLENVRTQAIPPSWQLSGLAFRARLIWIWAGKKVWGIVAAVALVVVLIYLFNEWALALWNGTVGS